MHLSIEGINLIKNFEKFSPKVYKDRRGIPTIGWGHTTGVTMATQPISQSQAEQFLWDDLEWAEKAIINDVKIYLTQCEFDALTSLVFNIGVTAFKTSHLLLKLNGGDKQGASQEFDRWVYVKNPETDEEEVCSDLQERRALEKQLFLEDFNSARSRAENA